MALQFDSSFEEFFDNGEEFAINPESPNPVFLSAGETVVGDNFPTALKRDTTLGGSIWNQRFNLTNINQTSRLDIDNTNNRLFILISNQNLSFSLYELSTSDTFSVVNSLTVNPTVNFSSLRHCPDFANGKMYVFVQQQLVATVSRVEIYEIDLTSFTVTNSRELRFSPPISIANTARRSPVIVGNSIFVPGRDTPAPGTRCGLYVINKTTLAATDQRVFNETIGGTNQWEGRQCFVDNDGNLFFFALRVLGNTAVSPNILIKFNGVDTTTILAQSGYSTSDFVFGSNSQRWGNGNFSPILVSNAALDKLYIPGPTGTSRTFIARVSSSDLSFIDKYDYNPAVTGAAQLMLPSSVLDSNNDMYSSSFVRVTDPSGLTLTQNDSISQAVVSFSPTVSTVAADATPSFTTSGFIHTLVAAAANTCGAAPPQNCAALLKIETNDPPPVVGQIGQPAVGRRKSEFGRASLLIRQSQVRAAENSSGMGNTKQS